MKCEIINEKHIPCSEFKKSGCNIAFYQSGFSLCPFCHVDLKINKTGKKQSTSDEITIELCKEHPEVSDNENDWIESMEKLKGINPNYAIGFKRGYTTFQKKAQTKIERLELNMKKVSEGTTHIVNNRDNRIKKQQEEIEELKKWNKEHLRMREGGRKYVKELKHKIEELEDHIISMYKQNEDDINKRQKYHDEQCRMKDKLIKDLSTISEDHVSYLGYVTELEQKLESMKCCGNCD